MLGFGLSYISMKIFQVSIGTTLVRSWGFSLNWVISGISMTLEIRSSKILSESRFFFLIAV